LGLLAAASVPASTQQISSSQPMRIILGLAPGGATDVGARILGKEYTDQTGQRVVVENRPGGGGTVAAMATKQAAPDGLTVLIMDNGACCTNPLVSNVSYDTLRDFKPVLLMWAYSTILVVPGKGSVKSVADLVALGRSRPEGLAYASQGVASGGHLMGALFIRSSKVPGVHVPYRGAVPAATDVAAGRADFLFASYASVNAFVTDNRVLPIASTGASGEGAVPGRPPLQTMIQAGYPDVNLDPWFALYAPIATPDNVVQQLHERFAKALRAPAVVQRLGALNMQVSMNSTRADLDAKVKDELARLRPIIKELNIRAN
jgi:tripartite-type tricarboxylate transporter receptor subunit TctC